MIYHQFFPFGEKMKLAQLRSFCEIIDNGFSVSKAAERLHTVASGVSKQLKLLEEDIGALLLVRKGTRITGLTDAGKRALPTIRHLLNNAERIRSIARDIESGSAGQLTIATTHINARYTLIPVFKRFTKENPKVDLRLMQGTPHQIRNWLLSGEADLGIGTVPLGADENLLKIPCFQHEHGIVVPKNHPLLRMKRVTLRHISRYPLIANYPDSRLGKMLEEALSSKGLDYRIPIRATDPSVIKKYVEVGFGIAVLPQITVDAGETEIRIIPAPHLFPASVAFAIMKKDSELPKFGQDFVRIARDFT